MRFLSFWLTLAGAFSGSAADKCDCSHFPIMPESCVIPCAQGTLNAAADVFTSVIESVSPEVIRRARCVILAPGVRQSHLIAGARSGLGFAVCRQGDGWGPPAAIRIQGGSLDYQIASTDLVLLVMNKSGQERILDRDSTSGGDLSVGAGPVGRLGSGPTNGIPQSELLSYSRSEGVLAGISLENVSIMADDQVNQKLYGKAVTNREVLAGNMKAPAAASRLVESLNAGKPEAAK